MALKLRLWNEPGTSNALPLRWLSGQDEQSLNLIIMYEVESGKEVGWGENHSSLLPSNNHAPPYSMIPFITRLLQSIKLFITLICYYLNKNIESSVHLS
jgi:hypothetical protein